MTMKESFMIHLFLFALYPILFLFAQNIEQMLFADILLPTAVVICGTVFLFLLVNMVFRDEKKGALFVSFCLLLIFSYGYVYEVIQGWRVGSLVIGRWRYLLLAWGIIFMGGTFFIIKVQNSLRNITSIANVIGIVLVTMPLVKIGMYSVTTGVTGDAIIQKGAISSVPNTSVDTTVLPDIYYIIFDRYGGLDTLRQRYDFDNSVFVDYLSQKGFYVATESTANYLKSSHSIASSLNMGFLNHLSEQIGEKSDNWIPLYKMTQDYPIWRFLKERGYTYIHLGSWWGATSRNKYADVNINLYPFSEFATCLYEITVFRPLIGNRMNGIFNKRLFQWKRVLYKFEKLAEIPAIKEPTFVFAHMLIPHWPYVFDREGNFRSQEEALKKQSDEKYIDQLIFTNTKVRMLIDTLLADSERPPIIVIQSDEGPDPLTRGKKDFAWQRATKNDLREKFKILNAYYLPGVDTSLLYPSITPVNSFRFIFNLYFHAQFELLPDESYIYADDLHIYKFINITDKISTARNE